MKTLRVIMEVQDTCAYCGGRGKVTVPVYHNDYETVKCDECKGTGQKVQRKPITRDEFKAWLGGK